MSELSKMTKGVVLTGGYGKRLGSICDPTRNKWAYPKPALTVGPKRIIDFSIMALHEMGVRDVCFATKHLSQSIDFLAQNRAKELGHTLECVQETEKRGTAGACKAIIEDKGWQNKADQIIVLSADIIHNLNIGAPFQLHVESKAAATIVVNELPWPEMYRFGSVRLAGMPERYDTQKQCFKSDEAFQDEMTKWAIDNRGKHLKIIEFREKRPWSFDEFMRIKDTRLKEAKELRETYEKIQKELGGIDDETAMRELGQTIEQFGALLIKPEQEYYAPQLEVIYKALQEKFKYARKEERLKEIQMEIERNHLALSNLNNSSIYFTSAALWQAFIPFITYETGGVPFHDFGSHLFRALAARSQSELHSVPISSELKKEILRGQFPFFAYTMPEKNDKGKNGKAIYWRDAGVPGELLEANHDALDGKIFVHLRQSGFNHNVLTNAWIGQNTYIAENATIVPIPPDEIDKEDPMAKASTIISHDVVINGRARIDRSVIGSFVQIGEGAKIENSVIMSPHYSKRSQSGQVKIGANVHLKDCIVIGADIEPGKDYNRKVIIEPADGLLTEEF